jgi:hypothetical protein
MLSLPSERKKQYEGKKMIINKAFSGWFEKSYGDQRYLACLAVRIHQRTIFAIAIIILALLTTDDSAYAQGGGGAGSYTPPRPVTGNGDFKALKAIAHLWHLWKKDTKATPIAPVAAHFTPKVPKRVAKKAPLITEDPKLTALPGPAPGPVAKATTLAVPAATPAVEGAEIQVFWWPVPDATVTNSQVTK